MMNTFVLLFVILILLFLLNKLSDVSKIQEKISTIRYYYNFSVYYLIVVFFLPTLILPIAIFRPKNVHNVKLYSYCVRFFTKIFIKDITFSMRNAELIPKDQGAVIVANHQSNLDILGFFETWNTFGKLTCLAKKELLYIWPFGLTAYLSGIIFIDRTRGKHSYEQLIIISENMAKQKLKILVCPEGTRNRTGKGLLPFKRGAFNIAVTAQVPIIPVVYSPYYFINPDQRVFNQGKIIMEFLKPIPTTGLTLDDVPKLAEQVRERMLEVYEQLSREVTNCQN